MRELPRNALNSICGKLLNDEMKIADMIDDRLNLLNKMTLPEEFNRLKLEDNLTVLLDW